MSGCGLSVPYCRSASILGSGFLVLAIEICKCIYADNARPVKGASPDFIYYLHIFVIRSPIPNGYLHSCPYTHGEDVFTTQRPDLRPLLIVEGPKPRQQARSDPRPVIEIGPSQQRPAVPRAKRSSSVRAAMPCAPRRCGRRSDLHPIGVGERQRRAPVRAADETGAPPGRTPAPPLRGMQFVGRSKDRRRRVAQSTRGAVA